MTRYEPDDPREWINRAHSNLAIARHSDPFIYWEELCFNAQQAAEKAIKAVFIHGGKPFPYIHNIGKLLGILIAQGITIPDAVMRAEQLTKFALESRYSSRQEVTQAEYEQALATAAAAVDWAEHMIGIQAPDNT
jgi:HEPN domain-containing protein